MPKRLFVLVFIPALFASFFFVAGCSEDEPHAAPATVTRDAVPTPTSIPVTEPPSPTATAVPDVDVTQHWWNDRVFYQIFVRSFFDSNEDGIGDLQGVIDKLDYLNDGDPTTHEDLGIGGIWLMPIAESPSYHGYDVVDYYAVEEDYGTNEDFRRLIDEAHERGIQVIVDLVLNHTSIQHPWFASARKGESEPFRDFFVWSDEDPGFRSPWGSRVWHRSGDDYYYGVFWDGMPDLNHENPAVNAEMEKVVRYWLEDMGADGFRLDGVKHLVEDGRVQENTTATHEWLQQFRTQYRAVNPDAMTVGEVWSPTRDVVKYVGDELDLAFEFDTAEAILNSAKYGNRNPILRAHRLVTERYPRNQFATFLTNHDMNRVMTQLDENAGHAKTAASLLLTGPGVPFVYYGEEIGHVGAKPDENIRTPMQWADQDNAGFTASSRAWRAPQREYRQVNVAAQTEDPDSLLSHYRRLVHIRNEQIALRNGDWREVDVADGHVYAFLRSTDAENLLVLINLGGEAIDEYALSLGDGLLGITAAHELASDKTVEAPTITVEGGFSDYQPIGTLDPFGTYIVRLD